MIRPKHVSWVLEMASRLEEAQKKTRELLLKLKERGLSVMQLWKV